VSPPVEEAERGASEFVVSEGWTATVGGPTLVVVVVVVVVGVIIVEVELL
jgi:hypothetical protein